MLIFSLGSINVQAQSGSVTDFDAEFLNWYNKDYSLNGVAGTSVNKAYDELIAESNSNPPIIVAVIDGGVEIGHEDLIGKIWLNEDEIAGNGIDDDNNGYIDDLHGWNFIGNTKGENVNYENLEFTRIVRKADVNDPNYSKAKAALTEELNNKTEELNLVTRFTEVYQGAQSIIYTQTGVLVESEEDLSEVNSTDEQVLAAKNFLQERFESGFSPEDLEEYARYLSESVDYHLNLDYAPRSLVGDDPYDINDTSFGNPDVAGPRADHGTSVAGVIAAVRDNDLGIDGIATKVQIMAIRSTPNGDERDKDVALAIRYAVDNGARIINMSFGKDFSPQKNFVDDAVRYAVNNDVLLVHAAGNDGKNIDEADNYPTPIYEDGQKASTWLTVGASALTADKELAAPFSNYGAKNVDIFAPGVDILSTDMGNSYNLNDGTSLAAPVVSGVAALIWQKYPSLSAEELIDIILVSAKRFKQAKKVYLPGSSDAKQKNIKFSKLSKSGGVINAHAALEEAEKRVGREQN